MTKVFSFEDGYAVIADTKKEAIERRIQEDSLDEEEAHHSLVWDAQQIEQEAYEDFDDLDQKYGVIEQAQSTTESQHQFLLETYGKDLEKAQATSANNIWTIVSTDCSLDFIVAGFHVINRIGYIQTLRPWENENEQFLW